MAAHLKSAFGTDTPLTGLSPSRIAEYKAGRLVVRGGGKPLTAAAVNRPLELLRNLLRQALRWKFIPEVPEIEFEDEPAGVVRFLRTDETTRPARCVPQEPEHDAHSDRPCWTSQDAVV